MQEDKSVTAIKGGPVENGYKQCQTCGLVKPIHEFSYLDRKYSKDGRNRRCKKCDSIMSKKTYRKNLEKNRGARSRWQKINHDKQLENARRWRGRNPDYFKEYYRKNKEVINAKARFRRRNPDLSKEEFMKKWREVVKEALWI